ncbi:MAG: zinc ribbon domain-containing protein [Planctomycetota bacterium]
MPTYEYRCINCDHSFEYFQSMTAKPLKKCPACEKLTLKRLIGTGAGVIFKGNGFYETDYRSESYTKARDAEKPKTDTEIKKADATDKTESKSTETTKESTSTDKSKPQKTA